MLILRVLLFPAAIVYDLITRWRNHLYNIGQRRSFRFETTVIGVGNLAAGGSGKTPMVEYLVRLLKPTRKLATLSRGYGRRTRGIRFASASDHASTLGDEPFQFARKFGDEVYVVVGEERAVAIPEILHRHPDTQVILLDDAFQHRRVEPQLSILLTDYAAPFYTDFVLPAGRLRESRKGASRADVIVVTKCPDTLSDQSRQDIARRVQQYAGTKPVFFSGLVYGDPVSFGANLPIGQYVILVSGIAKATLFETYARSRYTVVHHFAFGDHHAFSVKELHELATFQSAQKGNPVFLTTEKDCMRLIGPETGALIPSHGWYYLPIAISFLKNGPDFDNLVRQSAELMEQTR